MQPLNMKDALLTIDADDFAAEVSSVTLTPQTSTATWKGLKPTAVYQDVSSAVWTCNLTAAQDYDDPDSLVNYLLANAGDAVAAVFEPKAGGASFAVEIIIVAPTIGGAVDTFAEASISMPVNGQPVVTPA